jgi:hypothetical protein
LQEPRHVVPATGHDTHRDTPGDGGPAEQQGDDLVAVGGLHLRVDHLQLEGTGAAAGQQSLFAAGGDANPIAGTGAGEQLHPAVAGGDFGQLAD